jgi:hypothetical protein
MPVGIDVPGNEGAKIRPFHVEDRCIAHVFGVISNKIGRPLATESPRSRIMYSPPSWHTVIITGSSLRLQPADMIAMIAAIGIHGFFMMPSS